MVAKTRTVRIAERIRQELSEILVLQMQDPRLVGVSVTDVTVDRELNVANVYFSALEGSTRAHEIQAGFEHAQGFLRSELAARLDLRTCPRLRFHFDPTFEKAERIERLIASLHEDTATPHQEQV
jgi:ribosome-binding factor A